MMDKKRLIEGCILLEDAIVVAAITKYPNINELRNTRDYIMKLGEISSDEITEFQLKSNT